jgi:iron complex transport system ATP-binding protein
LELAMLRIDDVHFAFGASAVLQGVSIDVPAGGLVGILGPNGSGKTTLLRLAAGSLRPQSGSIRFDDEDVARIPRGTLARRLAVVPQDTQLAFDYTVLEIVLMGRYAHLGPFEVEGPDDLRSAHAALEATGTAPFADRAFRTLSGGEKQRVMIASALAQLDDAAGYDARGAGRLLFLDEPTASLDLKYQIEVAALLRTLHDRRHVTILLSTHDLHFARSVCDTVVLLGRGRVLASGLPAEVLTTRALAALYGIAESDVPVPLVSSR